MPDFLHIAHYGVYWPFRKRPWPNVDPQRLEAPMKKVRAIILVAFLALTLLTACSSDPVEVPDVIGYQLDKAHDKLKEAGFDKFNDVDVIKDRSIFIDANWVVLKQSPEGGKQAETGKKIRLEVAKIDDKGIIDRIPAGSPIGIRLRDRQDAATASQQAQSASEKAAVTKYIRTIDPRTRQFRSVIEVTLLQSLRNGIEASGTVTQSDMSSINDFDKAMTLYWQLFENVPKSINGAADGIQGAIEEFQRAARTLSSAEGPHARDSLDQFDRIFAGARTKYNSNLTKLYAPSGEKAPLLS
ncbi:PASTA domain-containing protein [Gordonia sp. (in: high G+C Gram-positive bacteria)]|uniref:PASTA domain-containing protein n=1 Tax=unclassified Gordonia (in: high G+C Gram-positive bacteria) TaxID=2657482 RepID=UPI0034588D7D